MKQFTMTEQHLTLLRNAYIEWSRCEWGAPAVDPKRPYGNGDLVQSIMELLGETGKACPHCGEALDKADDEHYRKLHRETQQALQVVLQTGSFVVGEYEASEYGIDWKLML